MFVARILYPVRVLGPGERIGIWFAGCPRRCPGCSNPELWEAAPRYRTTADTVMTLVNGIAAQKPVDGFTLTGGDPFAQPETLAELLPRLREVAGDILVYTGYRREELSAHSKILSQISVLIDGPYIEERNHNCRLRGSDNQEIHILEDALRAKYETYLRENGNQIQNFMTGGGVISVGIHRPGYREEFRAALAKKGLLADD